MKKAKVAAWAVIGLLVGAELLARAAGLVDFPLYEANATIGYIPQAQQSGSFMRRNDWLFNELHMGAGPFQPGPHTDILLVGDSLVYGGNTYRQSERLGPALQRQMGPKHQVWPIASGSWSISNQLTWLESHPEVVSQSDAVVMLFNSGDLIDEATSWKCERYHPRTRPTSALWYLLVKQMGWEDCTLVPIELQVPAQPWQPRWAAFLDICTKQGKPVWVILYPDKVEFGQDGPKANAQIAQQLQAYPQLKTIRLSQQHEWHLGLYKDGIHPTTEGNEVVARIVAARLRAGH